MKHSNIPIDKSKPLMINVLKESSNDCFTVDWEINNSECLKCSLYDICMVATLSKDFDINSERIREHSEYYFDELDWDNVPWDELLIYIKENPGKLSLNDLRSDVKSLAKVIDDKTVIYKLNNWFLNNNIKIKDGWLY